MKIVSMQQLEAIRDECRKIVTSRACVSAGASAVPVPGVDVGVDVTILVALIPQINTRFGLSEDQINELSPQTKIIILDIIKRVGSVLIGKAITTALIQQVLKRVAVRVTAKQIGKYIPIFGTILAAGLGFTAMKYVGNSHVNDCYEVVKDYLERKNAE